MNINKNFMKDESLFYGFCPESEKKGMKSKMKLNKADFFESEETGLQIFIIPNTAAILLNERGSGEFRTPEIFPENSDAGLPLIRQNKIDMPFIELA
jgi:hypothetical protein